MEEIIGYIADLTDEYMEKLSLPYEKYVKELTHIIASNEGLEDYVKSILIEKLNYYACYEVYERVIYYDLNRKLNSFKEDTMNFYNNASFRELTGGIYLYLAQTLMHEFEHIKQYKKACENKLDLETKIFRSIYKRYLTNEEECISQSSLLYQAIKELQNRILDITDNILYNRYYRYAIEDRLAEINSCKKTLEISKLLGLKCSYNYYLFKLYNIYLSSYDKEEPPTIYYFMKIFHKKLAKELKQSSYLLDFNTRLNLGLYLTEKEVKKIKIIRDKGIRN